MSLEFVIWMHLNDIGFFRPPSSTLSESSAPADDDPAKSSGSKTSITLHLNHTCVFHLSFRRTSFITAVNSGHQSHSGEPVESDPGAGVLAGNNGCVWTLIC